MNCPHCQKEITDDAKYCPYCGKKLKRTERRQNILKSEWDNIRNKSLTAKTLLNLALWIGICWLLAYVFHQIDLIDDTKTLVSDPLGKMFGGSGYRYVPITWAPAVTIFVFVLGFNIVAADIVKPYIKRQGENVVMWVTAIIVFTPLLAGIAYLLTWPKDRPLKM